MQHPAAEASPLGEEDLLPGEDPEGPDGLPLHLPHVDHPALGVLEGRPRGEEGPGALQDLPPQEVLPLGEGLGDEALPEEEGGEGDGGPEEEEGKEEALPPHPEGQEGLEFRVLPQAGEEDEEGEEVGHGRAPGQGLGGAEEEVAEEGVGVGPLGHQGGQDLVHRPAQEEEDDDEEPAAEEGQGFPQEVAVQGLHRSLQASAPAKAP